MLFKPSRQYGYILDINDAKQGERRLMMQHAVTRVLAESASLEEAMPAILGILGDAQEWVAAAGWRLTRDGTCLRCVDAWAQSQPQWQRFAAQQRTALLPIEVEREGLLMTALRTRLPHWIADVTQAPGYGRAADAVAAGLRGAFVMPVVVRGEAVRLIEFYCPDVREPDAMLIDLAESLGNQIGQFIERCGAQSALEQAREHLDMAVRASGIGFWDAEIGSDAMHSSGQMEGLLGYAAGALPAGQRGFLALLHPQDSAALRAAHLAGVKSGQPYAIEVRLRHRNGEWRWFRLRAQAFYGAAGRAVRIAGSISDIEERKRLERAKDEFVATVSHELRTPLTSIRGGLGLLDGGVAGELSADAKELVRVSLSGAERLSRLVNDVLNLAKIESGAHTVAPAPLVFDDLVRDAVRANEAYGREFGVTLHAVCGCAGALVLAEEDRLIQVVTNLISNAAKFSPAGAAVTVTTSRTGAGLRLEVMDHGSGIPSSFRARLFQKFSQVDGGDARSRQGSGLGLSICRALVDQMGGTIDFAQTPGGGATFYVELPAAPAAPAGGPGDGAGAGGGPVVARLALLRPTPPPAWGGPKPATVSRS